MLPMSGNDARRNNKLLRGALDVLGARLPEGWRARIDSAVSPRDRSHTEADVRLRIQGPDTKAAALLAHVKRSLEPRGVLELRRRIDEAPALESNIVIAPYLSPAVRQRLVENRMGFIDLTGNARIMLRRPGLFIDASGADVNPERQARSSRSLRGGKAGRIVRALVDRKQPPGIRELAKMAGVNPGYVSRVLAVLDRQALIERGTRGRIVRVDWPRLLERWAEQAPLSSRGTRTMCLDPRGLTALGTRLASSDLRYAVTGTMAVSDLAPVAPARLAVIYVDDIDKAVSHFGLVIAERGANVMLIEPADDGVFEGSTVRNGLRCAAVSQSARDLFTSPGRGPAEAEVLIAWMRKNEKVWRG
jgi:hypothetical protein